MWGLASGQVFLQPEMLTGQEPLDVGELRFNLHGHRAVGRRRTAGRQLAAPRALARGAHGAGARRRDHRRRRHRLRDRARAGASAAPGASSSSSAASPAARPRARPPACSPSPAAARGAARCSSSSAPARRSLRRRSPPSCATRPGSTSSTLDAGLLDLAFTSREAEQLDRFVARRRERGSRSSSLDGDAVRARYPEINPAVRARRWFADDASLNNDAAGRGAARVGGGARGRRSASARAVRRIVARRGRVHRGRGRRRARWRPGHVIVAAGAWSAAVGAMLRRPIPVRVDRGEMVAVQPRTPLGAAGLLARRLPGAAAERRGADRQHQRAAARPRRWSPPGAAATLLGRAVRMVPALADAPVTRVWSGLRPLSTARAARSSARCAATPTSPLACGHHRNGILLAPITAQLVAELLLERATSLDLQPFRHR